MPPNTYTQVCQFLNMISTFGKPHTRMYLLPYDHVCLFLGQSQKKVVFPFSCKGYMSAEVTLHGCVLRSRKSPNQLFLWIPTIPRTTKDSYHLNLIHNDSTYDFKLITTNFNINSFRSLDLSIHNQDSWISIIDTIVEIFKHIISNKTT